MAKQFIGIVGLGVMGENLALNMESKGFPVAGFDLDSKKVDSFAQKTSGKNAVAAGTLNTVARRPRWTNRPSTVLRADGGP